MARAGDGCWIAHTSSVTLNSLNLWALLVTRGAEPVLGAGRAIVPAPVTSGICVVACASRVGVARAPPVARSVLSTGALLTAIRQGVAEEAPARAGPSSAIVAGAVASARRTVGHTRTPSTT